MDNRTIIIDTERKAEAFISALEQSESAVEKEVSVEYNTIAKEEIKDFFNDIMEG